MGLTGAAVVAAAQSDLWTARQQTALSLGGTSSSPASGAVLALGRFRRARLAAVVAVAAVMWGWAAGQYPEVLVGGLTIAEAAGSPATVTAVLVWLLVGSVLVVPPLAALLWLSGQDRLGESGATGAVSRVGPGPRRRDRSVR